MGGWIAVAPTCKCKTFSAPDGVCWGWAFAQENVVCDYICLGYAPDPGGGGVIMTFLAVMLWRTN